jgi:hypothetical protein
MNLNFLFEMMTVNGYCHSEVHVRDTGEWQFWFFTGEERTGDAILIAEFKGTLTREVIWYRKYADPSETENKLILPEDSLSIFLKGLLARKAEDQKRLLPSGNELVKKPGGEANVPEQEDDCPF